MKITTGIKAFFILLWTPIAAVIGALLLLVTCNRLLVNFISARYVWTPMVLLISGVRVRPHNLRSLNKKRPAIYVANHSSLFDIIAIARVLPVGPFFIAKKELKKVPFMGWYMTMIGMIFVDRGNSDAAMKSMKKAAVEIQRGKNIVSFPEGTRSKTGKIGIFRRGTFIIAREGNIDIVPIGLSGADHVLPNGSFILRSGTIDVRFGDAIQMKDHQDKSIEELASYTRNKVVELASKAR
ncbi:MAG: 1-acyl-sn-glycerol-3-phosphate acyltransferase [Bacteroidota bacterium]